LGQSYTLKNERIITKGNFEKAIRILELIWAKFELRKPYLGDSDGIDLLSKFYHFRKKCKVFKIYLDKTGGLGYIKNDRFCRYKDLLFFCR